MKKTVITQDNFDHVVAKSKYLLIDFTATWCGPCKHYEQVLDNVAPDFPQFTFAQVDIDEQALLAEEFQVKSVPSTLIFKQSVVVCAHSGALSATQLRELLEQTQALDPSQLPKDP